MRTNQKPTRGPQSHLSKLKYHSAEIVSHSLQERKKRETKIYCAVCILSVKSLRTSMQMPSKTIKKTVAINLGSGFGREELMVKQRLHQRNLAVVHRGVRFDGLFHQGYTKMGGSTETLRI